MRLKTFWILGFIFSCLQALMVQKLVLPLMPSLHAGHGLLINDAIIFHEAATEAASRIRAFGWSEWSLHPTGFTGNVGLLSALYAIFGPEPAVFIPLNAAAHVTGGLMLYLIGPLLWPGRIGRTGGLVAAVLFVIFPSTLLWYSQNHKDAFVIAGMLMTLFAWLRVIAAPPLNQSGWRSLLLAAGGSALVLIFRPYQTLVIGGALLLSWLAVLTYIILTGKFSARSAFSSRVLSFMMIIWVAAIVGRALPASENAFKISENGVLKDWSWKATDLIPAWVEAPFRRISEIRVHFINYGRDIGAGSGVDEDRAPDTVLAALRYLPRAFLVGAFSPYPSSWVERLSATRLAVAGETFLWYAFVAGVGFLVWRRLSAELVGGLFFSIIVVAILSYTSPNVGTLYRVRFGYWMFFLLGGAIGWTSLLMPFLHRLWTAAGNNIPSSFAETDQGKVSGGIGRLAAAGFVAVAVAFVGFLGFLARDLLLINLSGMSGNLDAFFTAVMLPMVFVTCLIMPMADVITKPFLAIRQLSSADSACDIVARFLGVGVLVAAGAVAVTIVAAPKFIRMLTGLASDEALSKGTLYLRLFAPIIFLSVWTVLGNCVLNCVHRSAQAGVAQLIVPVSAVSSIVLATPESSLTAGIYGMLIGATLNASIVVLLCRREGIHLVPVWRRGAFPAGSLRSFCWLASAAGFNAILVPLNYYFASRIGEGSVSAWAFVAKIIVLFNSLFAFGVNTVVLPYLARKLDQRQNPAGCSKVYYLMVAGTWVGGFVALTISIFAEPLVYALLFAGNKITEEQISTLAHVLRLGVFQVPVAITGAIALKSAAVSGAAVRVMLASSAGLVVNLLLNWMLVPSLGLEGIAVGALGSLVVSTVLLCAGLRSGSAISMLLGAVLFVTWLVWAGAALAIESRSRPGMIAAAGSLLILVFLQWLFWPQNCSRKLHHPEF